MGTNSTVSYKKLQAFMEEHPELHDECSFDPEHGTGTQLDSCFDEADELHIDIYKAFGFYKMKGTFHKEHVSYPEPGSKAFDLAFRLSDQDCQGSHDDFNWGFPNVLLRCCRAYHKIRKD